MDEKTEPDDESEEFDEEEDMTASDWAGLLMGEEHMDKVQLYWVGRESIYPGFRRPAQKLTYQKAAHVATQKPASAPGSQELSSADQAGLPIEMQRQLSREAYRQYKDFREAESL